MAGRHYNNNLLDEASSFEYRPDLSGITPGYHGSNYTHALARGDDHFMLPMTTGDIHYGATEFGDFTSKMPEMAGFMSPEEAFARRAWSGAKWAAQPHNILPALGMGADYVFPGAGALFDLIDGGLYQLQGQNEMAGLAYGSMFLPVALAGGKRWFGAGVDMATGMPGASKYFGAQMKRPLYAAGDVMSNTYQKGMNVLRGGKPLIDDMSTTSKISADDMLKQGDEFSMPRYEGELDPYFIGNPNIKTFDMSNLSPDLNLAYTKALARTLTTKTGADAFMRFKHTYPELASQFKNVDEFDAYIKSGLDDVSQSGRVQYYDTPYTRYEPWGPQRDAGTHFSSGLNDIWQTSVPKGGRIQNVGKEWLETYNPDIHSMPLPFRSSDSYISVAAGGGRTPYQVYSTTGHELHHALSSKIWKDNFKLGTQYQEFLKSKEYADYIKAVETMPQEFAEPYLARVRENFIDKNYRKSTAIGPSSEKQLLDQTERAAIVDWPPITGYPRGTGDLIEKESLYSGIFPVGSEEALNMGKNIETLNNEWRTRFNYLYNPNEVSARAHEIRLMTDSAKKAAMERFGHEWGPAGQDILDYNPNFFKDGLLDKMYGMAPIGLGLGAMRGVNLLDYVSEE